MIPREAWFLPGIRTTRRCSDHEPLARVHKAAPQTPSRCPSILLLGFGVMQLLRESSQTPVETPRPAEKAGAARFRLLTIMPLIRRMSSCGRGEIRSICFRSRRLQCPTSPRFRRGSERSLGFNPSR
ncbi:hypothetical protein N431DRAFT_111141 [Stipitochalara longipes BDJ]|nr:hypothetical protein N431DRAFT_111141 [Stipitochalara longipes BDJ]